MSLLELNGQLMSKKMETHFNNSYYFPLRPRDISNYITLIDTIGNDN